jgi:hypothetical protein
MIRSRKEKEKEGKCALHPSSNATDFTAFQTRGPLKLGVL